MVCGIYTFRLSHVGAYLTPLMLFPCLGNLDMACLQHRGWLTSPLQILFNPWLCQAIEMLRLNRLTQLLTQIDTKANPLSIAACGSNNKQKCSPFLVSYRKSVLNCTSFELCEQPFVQMYDTIYGIRKREFRISLVDLTMKGDFGVPLAQQSSLSLWVDSGRPLLIQGRPLWVTSTSP